MPFHQYLLVFSWTSSPWARHSQRPPPDLLRGEAAGTRAYYHEYLRESVTMGWAFLMNFRDMLTPLALALK